MDCEVRVRDTTLWPSVPACGQPHSLTRVLLGEKHTYTQTSWEPPRNAKPGVFTGFRPSWQVHKEACLLCCLQLLIQKLWDLFFLNLKSDLGHFSGRSLATLRNPFLRRFQLKLPNPATLTGVRVMKWKGRLHNFWLYLLPSLSNPGPVRHGGHPMPLPQPPTGVCAPADEAS